MNATHTWDTRETDRLAHDVVAALESAWNAGDGRAYAEPFAVDATFVNVHGTVIHGRDAIAAGHDHIFSTIYAGSRNTIELLDAQHLTDDVVRLLLHAELHVPAGPVAGDLSAHATAVLVRTEGGWRVAAFHNTLETR